MLFETIKTPATAFHSLYFSVTDPCILCIKRLPKFTIFYHNLSTNFTIYLFIYFFCDSLTNFVFSATNWWISWLLATDSQNHAFFPCIQLKNFAIYFNNRLMNFVIVFHEWSTSFKDFFPTSITEWNLKFANWPRKKKLLVIDEIHDFFLATFWRISKYFPVLNCRTSLFFPTD